MEIEKTERKIQRMFSRACSEYSLLEDGDRVLVALSGGKDSLELVRLMARQQHILKPRIMVEAAHVVMDNIPYETDLRFITSFCERQGVRLNVIHTSFDEERPDTKARKRKTRCFLCSWQRRKSLFTYAEENGFTKVALGHHQDDILVTMLMNMTFEGSMSTIRPMMRMEHYPIAVIRPLCLVPERLIATVAEGLGFERQKTPCPYEEVTMRQRMTEVFRTLENLNPEARYSMWRAMERMRGEAGTAENI